MTFIVLTRPHTHAGQAHTVGERLEVDAGTADWLIANGIARHGREPAPVPQTEGDGTSIERNTPQRKEPKS